MKKLLLTDGCVVWWVRWHFEADFEYTPSLKHAELMDTYFLLLYRTLLTWHIKTAKPNISNVYIMSLAWISSYICYPLLRILYIGLSDWFLPKVLLFFIFFTLFYHVYFKNCVLIAMTTSIVSFKTFDVRCPPCFTEIYGWKTFALR